MRDNKKVNNMREDLNKGVSINYLMTLTIKEIIKLNEVLKW